MKRLIISILFLPIFCLSQNKNDKWIYATQFISGAADGVNQAIQAWHIKGNSFWYLKESWMNKYKDFPTDKRAAYWGSKGILVWTTDGYHLTRFIDRSFQVASLGISLTEKNNWKKIIKKVIIASLANRAAFFLFYNIIF